MLLTPIILQASRREVGRPQYFKKSSHPRLPKCSVDNSRPCTTPPTSQSTSSLPVPLCTGPSTLADEENYRFGQTDLVPWQGSLLFH